MTAPDALAADECPSCHRPLASHVLPIRPTPPAEPGLREALERLLEAQGDYPSIIAYPDQWAAAVTQARAALAAAPQAALDVERLARAMVASDPSHHLADRCEGCERNAKRIAAAYARAGEGEG